MLTSEHDKMPFLLPAIKSSIIIINSINTDVLKVKERLHAFGVGLFYEQ